jgi:ribonucleoside-diphosphate reductase beta chain
MSEITAAVAHTSHNSVAAPDNILDPGLCLTLRPMRFPVFYDMFRDGIKNTWTVEEVDFQTDLADLKTKITPAEVHVIQRLVAFFATGDSIVSNNLVSTCTSTSTRPKRGCIFRGSCLRRPCMCSST